MINSGQNAKRSMKSKCYVFSSHKQRNNVSLVYLKCKLEEDRYGSCTFKLKHKKTAEITCLKRSKP